MFDDLKDPTNIPDSINKASWKWHEASVESSSHWMSISGQFVKIMAYNNHDSVSVIKTDRVENGAGETIYKTNSRNFKGENSIRHAWLIAESYRLRKTFASISKSLKDPENMPKGIDSANWQWIDVNGADGDPADLSTMRSHWKSLNGNNVVRIYDVESLEALAVEPQGQRRQYFQGDDLLERAWVVAEMYRNQRQ